MQQMKKHLLKILIRTLVAVAGLWVTWSMTLSLIPTPSTAWLKVNFNRVWTRKWVFVFPKLLVKGYSVSHGRIGSHYFLYLLTLSAKAKFLVSGWEVRSAIPPPSLHSEGGGSPLAQQPASPGAQITFTWTHYWGGNSMPGGANWEDQRLPLLFSAQSIDSEFFHKG